MLGTVANCGKKQSGGLSEVAHQVDKEGARPNETDFSLLQNRPLAATEISKKKTKKKCMHAEMHRGARGS